MADTALGWRLVNPRMRDLDGGRATITLGDTAEEVALLDGITRQDCDAFALRSQERAARAWDKGFFDDEVVAVPPPRGAPLERDETLRPDTTAAALAGLRTSFRPEGVVTAGNASPLSDGASAVVVASQDAVRRLGLQPRARVVAGTSAGVPPHLMGLGPVPATRKLLDRLDLAPGDVGAVELNEAFAAQVLACVRRLGLDEEVVNADGGGIALGHPLGSSGCRLVVTLLGRMEREDVRRGLATLCIGVGQGASLLVERV